MDGLMRDLRSAWRLMAASPGWTIVAVLSLALGIGATTVVFSVVESVLLRPFPYPNPDRIVLLHGSRGSGSAADLAAYRDQAATIDTLALVSGVRMRAPEGGVPVATAAVSADVFPVLGRAPSIGTGLPARDDFAAAAAGSVGVRRNLAPAVVMLGHGFWQRHYGGDRSVLGTTLRLDGVPHEIAGVMPPGFFFPEPDVELWTTLDPPTAAGYTAVARLAPDAGRREVQAELDVISRRLDAARPSAAGTGALERRSVTVVPIREAAVSGFELVLWLLLGTVTLVLLIACANVANLLLARSVARSKELAVRASLGASRAMLVRQLVIESLALSVLGGLAGVALAIGGLRSVLGLGLVDIPRMGDAAINMPVLLFAAAVSIGTGLLAGVVPALRASRVDAARVLTQGGHTSSQSGSSRLRDALVVVEVALAVLLLVGAGLLVRSGVAMSRIDWGFNPDRLAVVAVADDVPGDFMATIDYVEALPTRRGPLVDAVLQRLRGLPDVVAAGASTRTPLVRGPEAGERVVADGAPVRSAVTARRILVTPGYLTALGVPLRGRDFDARDEALAERTVVLSQALARRLFGERAPIGQTVHFATLRAGTGSLTDRTRAERVFPPELLGVGGSTDIDQFEVTGLTAYTVVGVAADVRATGDLAADAADPAVYVDARQFQNHFDDDGSGRLYGRPANALRSFAIRTHGSPAAVSAAARAAIAEEDPALGLSVAAPMRTLVSRSLGGAGESGLILALSTVFGALSILLAAVGIYGVISHGVSQRVYEIGVRMALGARRRDIAGMVLSQGLRLAAAGLAAGLVVAWAGSRLLESRLYGISPTDPVTFAGVALFLLVVAAAAGFVPARRASRVDPVVATRAE